MQRPWISPDDVKEYTDYPEVAERSEGKLKQDILRAEMKIIKITNNRFDDDEKYPEIPEQVKLATILVAEAYAKIWWNAQQRKSRAKLLMITVTNSQKPRILIFRDWIWTSCLQILLFNQEEICIFA